MAPLLTNVFSKFSNILQPFTSYSYDLSLDSLKEEVGTLRENNRRLTKKVSKLKQDLEEYRVKSNRTTEFIYLLRVHNINID
jgi:regulator of replication initiation timing